MKNWKKNVVCIVTLVLLSSPAHAFFFNPMGMMGSMMNQMAQPVTTQMIKDMFNAMEFLMGKQEVRNDIANFMLGTADEMIYELMVSMEKGETTFVGAMATDIMTGGAEPGSAEFNQAMGHWMTVFGPAMQARMAEESAVQEDEYVPPTATPEELAIQKEIETRRTLGVYIAEGDWNWDTRDYDRFLAIKTGPYIGDYKIYIPTVALAGDPN